MLVTADFVWAKDESHFAEHRYRITSYVYNKQSGRYSELDQYVTQKKYAGLGNSDLVNVLEPEKATIIQRLQMHSGPPRTMGAMDSSPQSSGIRAVDFRNFQYRADFLKETVRVSNGEWKEVTADSSPGSWFQVVKIVYGDLTGDGQEEAVVLTASGGNFNFEMGQLFVFSMTPHGPTLLQSLSLSDSSKNDEIDWSRISDVRVTGGQLEISWLGGQCRACTDWTAKATFKWNGSRFMRTGLTRTALR
jgi:hypothetical protein